MADRRNMHSPVTAYLDGELSRLEQEWPGLVEKAPPLPHFTWEDLLEALLEEVPSPMEQLVIRGAMAALLKMAPFKPPEMVLREVLILTSSAFTLAGGQSSETEPGVEMI